MLKNTEPKPKPKYTKTEMALVIKNSTNFSLFENRRAVYDKLILSGQLELSAEFQPLIQKAYQQLINTSEKLIVVGEQLETITESKKERMEKIAGFKLNFSKVSLVNKLTAMMESGLMSLDTLGHSSKTLKFKVLLVIKRDYLESLISLYDAVQTIKSVEAYESDEEASENYEEDEESVVSSNEDDSSESSDVSEDKTIEPIVSPTSATKSSSPTPQQIANRGGKCGLFQGKGAYYGSLKKKEETNTSKKKKLINIDLSGVTDEQTELISEFFEKEIVGFVESNCGADEEKDVRTEIRKKWSKLGGGRYTSLIPSKSTKTSMLEKKKAMIKRERQCFIYWLCKAPKTNKQMKALSFYVNMAKQVERENDVTTSLGEHVTNAVAISVSFDNDIKSTLDGMMENELNRRIEEENLSLKRKAETGPSRSTRSKLQ